MHTEISSLFRDEMQISTPPWLGGDFERIILLLLFSASPGCVSRLALKSILGFLPSKIR